MRTETKLDCTIEGRYAGLAHLFEKGERWGARVELACTVEELVAMTYRLTPDGWPLLLLALEDGRAGRCRVLQVHGKRDRVGPVGEACCVMTLTGAGPLGAASPGVGQAR